MNFGEQNWGRADWGSDDGPIVHDISVHSTTAQPLSLSVTRLRRVVLEKDTTWGRFNWGRANWGGIGDNVLLQTGQALTLDITRLRSGIFTPSTTSTLVPDMVRFRSISTTMTTSQLLEVLIRGAVRGEISISVSLAPGETLEIDTEKLLAEIENSNAMPNYTGDWPDLIPGDNVFIYSDSESSRSIEVVITKKDRFI